jgi:hypothetical protein
VFVDIGDVAFFLVETLPRKFAFLIDAKNLRYQSHVQIEKKGEWRERNDCARVGEIKDRRTPY